MEKHPKESPDVYMTLYCGGGMSEELKTLKDIKEIKGGKTKLRDESVKWVKRMSNYEALAWKKFFNLTPADLGEEK